MQANRLMEPSMYHMVNVESYLYDLQSDMACVLLSSLWLANVVEPIPFHCDLPLPIAEEFGAWAAGIHNICKS